MAVGHASIQRKGKTFEVLLDESAKSKATVFRSVARAERASRKELLSAFGTTNQSEITRTILREASSAHDCLSSNRLHNNENDADAYNEIDNDNDVFLHAIATELRRNYRLPETCECGLNLDEDFHGVLQAHGIRVRYTGGGDDEDASTQARRLHARLTNLPCMRMDRAPEGVLLVPVTLDRRCMAVIRRHATVLQRTVVEETGYGGRNDDGIRMVQYDVFVHEHERLFAELAGITGGRYSFELREAPAAGMGERTHGDGAVSATATATARPKSAKEKRRLRHRKMKMQRQVLAAGEDVLSGK